PLVRIQRVALLAVFLGLVCQFGLIAIRKQGAMAIANGVALAAVIALGLILIPLYEDVGAAVAAVVGETILTLLLLLALARSDRKLFPNFAFAWKVALTAVVACVAFIAPVGPVLAPAIEPVLHPAGGRLPLPLPPEL